MIDHALTESGGSSYFSILQSILRLRLMCDHGKALLPSAVQNRLEGYSYADHNANPSRTSDIEMEDYVQEESPTQPITSGFSTPRCALCNKATDAAEGEFEEISFSRACSHIICDSCLRLYELNTTQLGTSSQISCPKCAEIAGFPLESLKYEDNPRWMEDRPYGGPSTKVKALIKNLQLDSRNDDEGQPIKSVVFSCWTKMLDLISVALNNEGMRFCQYDGRHSMRQRDESVRCFRADPQTNVLLISIDSGAVGLNLTVASRVHLMEPQWNPMVEHQALDRVHRIGQKNKVVTTRYIVKNSIEEVSKISRPCFSCIGYAAKLSTKSMLSFQKRKLAIAGILTCQTQKPTSNQHLKELQNLLMA